MATSSSKQPPVYNPDGGDSYLDWKVDVQVWRISTKEEPKRHGALVYGALLGDAKIAVRDLSIADLSKDDSFEKVIAVLDGAFLKDTDAQSFSAIKNFVEFHRESGQSFIKFIVELNADCVK